MGFTLYIIISARFYSPKKTHITIIKSLDVRGNRKYGHLRFAKKDHNKVKQMLEALSKKRDDKLLKDLAKEVYVHSEAEEEAFYNPLRPKSGDLKVIIDVGHDEHDLVSKMMEKLQRVEDDKEWKLLFSTIKCSLEGHIAMEEKTIFALSKKCFSAEEAKQLAENMLKSKAKFEAKA